MDLVGRAIGNYTFVRQIGEGGMGVVWLARHELIGRHKAVKVLRAEAAAKPALVRRFFDEAVAASAVHHDHIVAVDDAGTINVEGQPLPYLVMEYLEGRSLGAALRAEGGRFDEVARVARITATAADALAAAHDAGIVHRDLKPENLFLARRGARHEYVKVLDFGIARLTGALAAGARTRTGQVIGTPEYMSPEQARGLHPDGKSDVWSLGTVLYRALTGRLPFVGETFALLAVQICKEPAPNLGRVRPGVPRGIVRLVDDMLAKEPTRRPDMRGVRDRLFEEVPEAAAPQISILVDSAAEVDAARGRDHRADAGEIQLRTPPTSPTSVGHRGVASGSVELALGREAGTVAGEIEIPTFVSATPADPTEEDLETIVVAQEGLTPTPVEKPVLRPRSPTPPATPAARRRR